MSQTFEELRRFISSEMRMSHVYQPVMLQALLTHGGQASVREIAEALLGKDEAQRSYYEEITRRMPGAVLRRRGIVEFDNGTYRLPDIADLTEAEKRTLIDLCLSKIDDFLARRRDPWAHRRTAAGLVCTP